MFSLKHKLALQLLKWPVEEKISPETYSFYTVNQKMTQEWRLTSSYHIIEEF